MYKIKIFSIGKNRESWLIDALAEYEKRLKTEFTIEWHLVKDDASLKSALLKENHYIALDPLGRSLSSPQFSERLFATLLECKSRLSFVIGGDMGLDDEMRAGALFLLSLSPMTFTHQMTRLILLEQIYRAAEIQKGSPYHK